MAEKYYNLSPYAYCANNPVNFVDPDGRRWYDALIGYAIGAMTNIVPMTGSARDLYSPTDASDYNSALRTSDNVATVIGATLIKAGGTAMAGGAAMAVSGTAITVSTAVAAAVVGVPSAAVGGNVAVVGAATAGTGATLMLNSANNKSGGYERGRSNLSSGNKNSKHANQKARVSAAEKYKDSQEKYKNLKGKTNKTQDDKLQLKQLSKQVDYWKLKMDNTGETHSRTHKGNR